LPYGPPKIRRAVGVYSAHGPSFPYDTSAVGGNPRPIRKVIEVISALENHHLNPFLKFFTIVSNLCQAPLILLFILSQLFVVRKLWSMFWTIFLNLSKGREKLNMFLFIWSLAEMSNEPRMHFGFGEYLSK